MQLDLRLLLRHIAAYGPSSLVPGLVTLAITAIFTRVFETAEYGRYSLAFGTAAFLTAISFQWLKQGINRFLPEWEEEDSGRVLRMVSMLSIGVGALFWITLGMLVSRWYGSNSGGEWATLIMPVSFLVAVAGTAEVLLAILQASMKAGSFSAVVSTTAVVRLIASIVAVFLIWDDPASLLWAAVAGHLVLLPILFRSAGVSPSPRYLRQGLRSLSVLPRLVRYGLPMIGWYVSSIVLSLGDRYVIEWARGSSEVGIYAANYGLVAGAIGLLAAPVRFAAHPFLMRAWAQGDEARVGEWLGQIVFWTLMLGAAAVGGLVLFSGDLAALILGHEFREGHLIMPLIMAGVVFWTAGLYSHKPLEFAEQTTLMFWIAVAVALLNLLLNVVLVPRYGYLAAAGTTLVSYAAYFVATLHMGRRRLAWKVNVRRLFHYAAATAMATVAVVGLRQGLESWLGAPAGVLGAIVISLALLAWLGRLAWSDLVERPGTSPTAPE